MKKKGITLIALIITIVVLLILAGVTMSFVVGDNGVVNQAINAKGKMEEADRKEQIEMMLMSYIARREETGEQLPTYLDSRKGKEIDDALQLSDPNNSGKRVNAVIKDGIYYMILENENGDYYIEELNTDLGNIEGGITLATPENFDKEKNGTMTFNPRRRRKINISI